MIINVNIQIQMNSIDGNHLRMLFNRHDQMRFYKPVKHLELVGSLDMSEDVILFYKLFKFSIVRAYFHLYSKRLLQ